MKYCAVICELNPFHNGHEYIFRKAREVSGCDRLIAIMSGPFVQRGRPAVSSERLRAECAMRYGADAVIELPVVYAAASGEIFARGAVNILNTMPDIVYLVMGTESDDPELLRRIAEIRAENGEKFNDALAARLGEGLPYARALTRALCDVMPDVPPEKTEEALTCPNNILAIAYAAALIASGSRAAFMPVKRANDPDRFASATALRGYVSDRDAEKYMPPLAREILHNGAAADEKAFDLLVMHALRSASLADIASTPDCAEGFEHKLKDLARVCGSFSELMSAVPTSRFTRSRIMRICLQTLLGITRDMQHSGYVCARLIGVREDTKDLLSVLPENIIIGKRGEAAIPREHLRCFAAERRASDIYSLICGTPCDFYSRLLTV